MRQSNKMIYFVNYCKLTGFVDVVQRGLVGKCGSFGSVSLSLSLFVFESAPTGPWQTPKKPFTVQAISGQAKEGLISWELSLKQAAHKKRAGEAVSVFKNGLFNGCPTLTYTQTDQTLMHVHTQTLPCIDAQAHTHLHTHIGLHIHWYLTVGQWHGGLRSWIMGMFLSSVIYLAAIFR